MQAEGIREGDRLDVYDDRGRVIGGWTATGNAVVVGELSKRVYVPVKYHDGTEGTNHWPVGMQVPITWGSGTAPEHYVINNGVRHDIPTPLPPGVDK